MEFIGVLRLTSSQLMTVNVILMRASRYALVWGKSSKFNPQPQKVGLTHLVQDEDVCVCVERFPSRG